MFFLVFCLGVVLGLSRLLSGETSCEMQVSCGLDTENCCKKQIFTLISVFSVCDGGSAVGWGVVAAVVFPGPCPSNLLCVHEIAVLSPLLSISMPSALNRC